MLIVAIIAAAALVFGAMHRAGILLPKKGTSARELVNETAAAAIQTRQPTQLALQEQEDVDLTVLNLICEASDSPTSSIRWIRVAQRAGLLSTTFPEELVNCGAASLIFHINQKKIARGEIDITPEAVIGRPTPTR